VCDTCVLRQKQYIRLIVGRCYTGCQKPVELETTRELLLNLSFVTSGMPIETYSQNNNLTIPFCLAFAIIIQEWDGITLFSCWTISKFFIVFFKSTLKLVSLSCSAFCSPHRLLTYAIFLFISINIQLSSCFSRLCHRAMVSRRRRKGSRWSRVQGMASRGRRSAWNQVCQVSCGNSSACAAAFGTYFGPHGRQPTSFNRIH
jgi:hypothetical protein